MIKIKDLRPRNIIYSPTSSGKYAIGAIDSIDGPTIFVQVGENYYSVQETELDGIPLTHELMKNLGFHLFDKGSGVNVWKITFSPGNEYMCSVIGGEFREDGEFNYLHELQNAFADVMKSHLPVKIDMIGD